MGSSAMTGCGVGGGYTSLSASDTVTLASSRYAASELPDSRYTSSLHAELTEWISSLSSPVLGLSSTSSAYPPGFSTTTDTPAGLSSTGLSSSSTYPRLSAAEPSGAEAPLDLSSSTAALDLSSYDARSLLDGATGDLRASVVRGRVGRL